MTHVIYDHQIFSWQEHGGISRYFHELAKRVGASAGFSASVVAPLYVNRYLRRGGVSTRGICIPSMPRVRRPIDIANRRIESVLLKWSRPDVVHETYYQAAASAPEGCKVVITVHDMIQEKFLGKFGRNDATSAKKRAAVSRADRVICVSENTRKDLMELFNPDPAKIRTIHWGFNFAGPDELPEAPRLGRPFFLYVGMRGSYKNFDNLLRAYASRPALRQEYELIAFGMDGFTSSEIETIGALGLKSSQVRHLSGDDALLGHLYSKASALIYPSLYEGFGIPPLEAMSFGCPVLCSNTSSIPEIVGDAGLYFDPGRIDAIADTMERVVSSAELRLELVARGKERVKHFSWDRCVAQTLEVYRDLARSPC